VILRAAPVATAVLFLALTSVFLPAAAADPALSPSPELIWSYDTEG